MKIYVLTTGNKDRMSMMERQLNSLNLKFEFIYSESIENLETENLAYGDRQLSFKSRKLSTGQFGAWKAHTSAWNRVVNDLEPAIVIEDNALIHQKIVLNVIKCETIKLGMVSFSETGWRESATEPFIKTHGFFPLYIYGITPYFADMLLSRANKTGYSMQIDTWITKRLLSGISPFCSNTVIGSRMPRKSIATIAQKDLPKKAKSIKYKIIRMLNKRKYKL